MSENIEFPDLLQDNLNRLADTTEAAVAMDRLVAKIKAMNISDKERDALVNDIKILCNSCSILAVSSFVESIKKGTVTDASLNNSQGL